MNSPYLDRRVRPLHEIRLAKGGTITPPKPEKLATYLAGGRWLPALLSALCVLGVFAVLVALVTVIGVVFG